MTHNSKKNHNHTAVQDGDDYVYPTKKIRETKTRNRKHDKNLIKAGLIDEEYCEENSPEDDWYDDQPMSEPVSMDCNIDDYNYNETEDEIDGINDYYADKKYDDNDKLDDVNTNWDRRWEDY